MKYRKTIRSYLAKTFSYLPVSWAAVFSLTAIIANFYLLCEWIFIITKPSFLSAVSLLDKISVYLFASSVFNSASFLLLGSIFIICRIPGFQTKQKLMQGISIAIPTVTFACLGLLLMDNFTYTIFHFGIATSATWVNLIYLVVFSFLVCYSYKKMIDWARRLDDWRHFKRIQNWLIPCLVLMTISVFAVTYKIGNQSPLGRQNILADNNSALPNIILVTGDGVDASHLSVYGYSRETTPNITELAKTALVAENAFTNAGHTAGSLISIYTSKFPTETRVLYPPDILKNEDVYQHLPGVLNSLGYHTAQFTTPYFGDAYTLNLQNGFDVANGRAFTQSSVYTLFNRYFQTDQAYFLYEISNRIIDRLRDISFIKKMTDQTGLIQGRAQRFNDEEKVDSTLKQLTAGNQPFFTHLHWMGTHGPTYLPEKQVFSKGRDPAGQALYDDDFYDDTLLDFDRGVGRIMTHLSETGLDSNTIIIIGSDHNRGWLTMQKIPLIIHFPDGQFIGSRQSNIQNMDIAPTVLDYMGITRPDWMEGSSFLHGELPNRLIFSTGANEMADSGSSIVLNPAKPPFYQFKFIGMIDCGSGYRLDLKTLKTLKILTTQVFGYSGQCIADPVSRNQVLEWAQQHLGSEGYDVSSLIE